MKYLLLLVVCLSILPAQERARPRGLDAGSLDSLPFSTISSDAPPTTQFSLMPDGTRVYIARFHQESAAGVRLHLRDFHVSQSARVFIYAPDGTSLAGPFTGSGPVIGSDDFWVPPVPGDTAVVEYQVDGEAPPELPFRVAGITSLDAAELQKFLTPAPSAGESSTTPRTSLYQGLAITHTVQEGLAVAEGDILLGPADQMQPADDSATTSGLQRRSYSVGSTYSLWANGVLPYVIDSSMVDTGRITSAIAHWNARMNGVIKIVPRTNEIAYLVFTRSPSSGFCSSFIGRIGMPQPTYLGDSCSSGNVIHEIGHVLGLYHEHTRSDRDSYVKIDLPNIDPSSAYNFATILGGKKLTTYDFNSIMHYPAYAFSINGRIAIETIPAGIPIGQRDGLSAGDIAGIQALYGGTLTPIVATPTPAPTPAPPPTPTPVSPPTPAPPPSPPPPAPVATGDVALATNPPGLQLTFDGNGVNTPFTSALSNAGTNHTIAAPAVQTTSGTRYTFGSWSNGSPTSFSFSQTAGETAFTASYSTQYQVTTSTSGSGTVSVSPASPDGYYSANSVLSLTAAPQPGSCFTGWTGLLAGTGASTNLTVTRPGTVTANFSSGAVSLDTTWLLLQKSGSNGKIGVMANGSCGWAASASADWVSFPNGASGNGSGTLNFVISANPTASLRFGTINIGGNVILVYQFAF